MLRIKCKANISLEDSLLGQGYDGLQQTHPGTPKGNAKLQCSIADERKSQVGTGDRSERIRTYNYPQGRISDHRIGLTVYKLEQFLNGDLDEVIDALITYDTAQKLKSES